MSDEKKPGHRHPNSLKNLKPITSPEMANEYRERGLETRRKKAAMRAEVKEKLELLAEVIKEDPDAFSALGILRHNMVEAMEEGNVAEATRIAAIVAEYEAPKLQRVDQHVTERVEELSDEELEAEIEKLRIVK